MAYDWTSSTIFGASYIIDYGQSVYATNANNIFVVFNDWNSGLLFSKSTNGGSSWSTPVVIDSNWGDLSQNDKSIWVSADTQTIYITYADVNYSLIYFVKSTNGGTSFGSPVNIDANTLNGSHSVIDCYGIDGQNIYIAYAAYVESPTTWKYIRLAWSDDYGVTWNVVNVQDTVSTVTQDMSIKVLSQNDIYILSVAYASGYPDNWGVTFSKTNNKGSSWTHTYLDSPTTCISMYVKDLDTIYVAYVNTVSVGTTKILYYMKSTDAGDSFSSKSIIDNVTQNDYVSINSPNGLLIFISYRTSAGVLKVAYSSNGGIDWTIEEADNFSSCGINSALFAISSELFIVHSTLGSCDSCMRLTKAPVVASLPISSILMYKFRPVVLT
jgi:hypothetical protein